MFFLQIFFLMITFGLFHGLILLPVILSLIGSRPHKSKEDEENERGSNVVELENLKEVTTKLNDDINSPS